MVYRVQEFGDYDYLFKVVVVGDSGVGKTNLVNRFMGRNFETRLKETIGIDFDTQNLNIKGHKVTAQLWDTAGQERYRSFAPAYYRGAAGAMLVYDSTKASSFHNVRTWLKVLRENTDENLLVMLIGNKTDLKHLREVSASMAENLAKDEGLFFMETSALNCSNVEVAFTQLIAEIYHLASKKVISIDGPQPSIGPGRVIPVSDTNDEQKEQKRSACCY